MASVVAIVGSPHDPTLLNTLVSRGTEDTVKSLAKALGEQHALIEDSEADAVVVVAGDHLNELFLDNMPAFMIGKAPRSSGPFPDEVSSWGLTSYDVSTDGDLARRLLRFGLENGVDFAASDEYLIDHAFTVPLSFVCPHQNLPIVPIFTNVLAPPLPSARRFYDVGTLVRDAIETWDEDRRIAVIVTGHMVNNVGGPRMMDFLKDPSPEWDVHTWGLIEDWKLDQIIEEATWEKLNEAGHATPAFLDFIFGFGVAKGVKPSHSDLISGIGPALAMFSWDEKTLQKGTA